MKLTSLAIIFIIIISPFLFISAQESKVALQDQRLRYYYDNVIDNAIQDAALILSEEGGDFTYSDNIGIFDTKELAAQGFFDSLYHAFDVSGSPSSKARVNACVPLLVFLEKDGFLLYALDSYKNAYGQNEVKHIWFPMQQYISEPLFGRYIVRYTLSNEVYIYDSTDQILYQGDYLDYCDKISFFNDSQLFENLRIAAVKNSIQEKVKDYMNQYNKWSAGRSLSVKLEFPSIDDADWIRALTDEGILVFAQGFPIARGKSYQHYALGGARVIRRAPLVGYTYDGNLYYCNTNCGYYENSILNEPSFNPDATIHFTDAYEAAGNGYFPCPYCRP